MLNTCMTDHVSCLSCLFLTGIYLGSLYTKSKMMSFHYTSMFTFLMKTTLKPPSVFNAGADISGAYYKIWYSIIGQLLHLLFHSRQWYFNKRCVCNKCSLQHMVRFSLAGLTMELLRCFCQYVNLKAWAGVLLVPVGYMRLHWGQHSLCGFFNPRLLTWKN